MKSERYTKGFEAGQNDARIIHESTEAEKEFEQDDFIRGYADGIASVESERRSELETLKPSDQPVKELDR